jgi:hypothetical protein
MANEKRRELRRHTVITPEISERRFVVNGRRRKEYRDVSESNVDKVVSLALRKRRCLDNERRRKKCHEKAESNVDNTVTPAMRERRCLVNEQRRKEYRDVSESNVDKVVSLALRKRRCLDNERRRKKYHEEAKSKKQVSNIDRDNYCSEYDEKTRFIACALCGIENSQTGSILVADTEELVEKCGIREEYKAYVKITDDGTIYDKSFIEEVKKHFDCGLIKGLKSICAICRSEMKKNVRAVTVTAIIHLPKMTNFKGLFTGSIPTELLNLTAVDDSMINIYSASSKVCLAGGKHYKINSGTC